MKTSPTSSQVQDKKTYGPKLFVGRIGPTTTPTSMRRHFECLCAVQVVKIEFSKKSKNRKGFGYVIIENPDDLTRVLEHHHVLDGKPVDVYRYGLEATTKWYNDKEKSIKVKVVNIPADVSEQIFTQFFEDYSKVLVVNILEEQLAYNTLPVRYALVEMLNTGVRLKVGKCTIRSKTQEIQYLNYIDIERIVSRNSVSQGQHIYNQKTITPFSSSSIHKNLFFASKLEFGKYEDDKHSKYEFLAATRHTALKTENYRFNISILTRTPTMVNSSRPTVTPYPRNRIEHTAWHRLC